MGSLFPIPQCHSTFSNHLVPHQRLSSSYPSFTVGSMSLSSLLQHPSHRNQSLSCQSRGIHRRPRSLFGGFFGRTESNEPTISGNEFYDDVTVPFPASLLKDTFLAGRELKCCYKASIDGFSAATFHQKCDFKGPCVIICQTEKSVRFGAFNPEGYRSTDDYYDTTEAFLFYWSAGQEDPVILPKVGGSGAALFDYARGGPQFGADGLLIGAPLAPVMGGFSGPDTNSGVGILSEAKSRLGLSYAKRPDEKDSIFGDERSLRERKRERGKKGEIAREYNTYLVQS